MFEIPITLIVFFVILCFCAVVGVTTFIIDTKMNIDYYNAWIKEVERNKQDKNTNDFVNQIADKVGEKLNSEKDLGGGKD